MNQERTGTTLRSVLGIVCAVVLATGDTLAYISSSGQESTSAQNQTAKVSSDRPEPSNCNDR